MEKPTVKAIYTGREFQFEPQEPIPVQGRYSVVITFVEELPLTAEESELQLQEDLAFSEHLRKLYEEAADEKPLDPLDFLLCPDTFEKLIQLSDGTLIKRDGTVVRKGEKVNP
ncbi:MAG: hypothetical protein FWG65_00920 [Turicibacter sp.]|nr:hypothetical protein [Turicibacter sp.]